MTRPRDAKRREEINAKQRDWRAAHPGHYRRWHLAAKYNLNESKYQKMLKDQGGRCAICRAKNPGGRWKNGVFFVDHNHATGEVRGLLCNECNKGLGFFRDSAVLLQAAVRYIAESGGANG